MILDLDSIDEGRLDVYTVPGALATIAQTLQLGLVHGYSAFHFFYHEECDLVRQCVWKKADEKNRAGWTEAVPLDGKSGRAVLVQLRTHAESQMPGDDAVLGGIRVKLSGTHRQLVVESPHIWDVRLYAGDDRPSRAPYSLVFTGSQNDLYEEIRRSR